jgi:uncharacterized protein YjiS (DUF1127 family)
LVSPKKRTETMSGPSQAPGYYKAYCPSSAHDLAMRSRRTHVSSEKTMSKQFRDAPRVFVRHHGFKFPHHTGRTPAECEGSEQNRGGPFGHRAASVLLRDDHIIVAAIDALLALHASFKKWRNRRKTLRVLADLDDRQLRDIGLTRDDSDSYRPLAGVDDAIARL